MKKILLSIATLGVLGAAVVGGTTAIFSDTEVSTGNTFTAGAVDLQIDNESYYNGERNDDTSWILKDLEEGDWFFDFRDLKPGDWGEDTISLHVNNNDSWLCADVTLTSNQDNGSTEPEENDETPYTAGEGELADEVYFIWWADDGDNVLEDDEQVLNTGTLGTLGLGQTATVALADSQTNIWEESGPLPGGSDRYIGKAWCFGSLTTSPVTPGDNDPTDDPGFDCNGSGEDNSTQTDSLTADISFRAEQARHQDDFQCAPPDAGPTTATLTVDKRLIVSTPGIEVDDFRLEIQKVGDSGWTEVTDEDPVSGLTPGDYLVKETYSDDPSASFDVIFGLGCDDNNADDVGEITLAAGDNKTCRIDNEEQP